MLKRAVGNKDKKFNAFVHFWFAMSDYSHDATYMSAKFLAFVSVGRHSFFYFIKNSTTWDTITFSLCKERHLESTSRLTEL